MTEQNNLVAEFPKSDIEIGRLSLTNYKGKNYFDIWLYYREEG